MIMTTKVGDDDKEKDDEENNNKEDSDDDDGKEAQGYRPVHLLVLRASCRTSPGSQIPA